MKSDYIQSHRDLLVWQRSMSLVSLIYLATNDFPSREVFGLTAQIRRSAVSIPSNIAEGRNRSSRKEYRKFIFNALGSAAELDCQLEIAKNIGLISPVSYEKLSDEVVVILKMLKSLSHSLNKLSVS